MSVNASPLATITSSGVEHLFFLRKIKADGRITNLSVRTKTKLGFNSRISLTWHSRVCTSDEFGRWKFHLDTFCRHLCRKSFSSPASQCCYVYICGKSHVFRVFTVYCRFLAFSTLLNTKGALVIAAGETFFTAAHRVSRGRTFFHQNLSPLTQKDNHKNRALLHIWSSNSERNVFFKTSMASVNIPTHRVHCSHLGYIGFTVNSLGSHGVQRSCGLEPHFLTRRFPANTNRTPEAEMINSRTSFQWVDNMALPQKDLKPEMKRTRASGSSQTDVATCAFAQNLELLGHVQEYAKLLLTSSTLFSLLWY